MDSLISPDQTWLLWAVILAGVALSIWMEQRYTWAAKVSGPVVALVLAILLSNLRVMPTKTDVVTGPNQTVQVRSPDGSLEYVPADSNFAELEKNEGQQVVTTRGVYEIVQEDLVPLALPLLLFRANIFHIIRSTGWLFVSFHIAALGTIIGAFIGAFALRNVVTNVDELAGIMTGSYIGGGINFFAVADSIHADKSAMSALLVADSFVMAAMFLVLLIIAGSKWAKRNYPHPFTADAVDSKKLAAEHWRRKEISLFDISAALAIAVSIVALARLTSGWVADFVSNTVQDEQARENIKALAGNRYLHITIWSMLIATVAHRFLARIHGADEFGGYLLYVFLFVIGLPADLWMVVTKTPELFVLCLIMAVVNLLVTMIIGWMLRLNLEHLTLSVNATLGGPPSAAAMAISKGWSDLVLPAILVGIWGYAIGTACGLTVRNLIRQWMMT